MLFSHAGLATASTSGVTSSLLTTTEKSCGAVNRLLHQLRAESDCGTGQGSEGPRAREKLDVVEAARQRSRAVRR